MGSKRKGRKCFELLWVAYLSTLRTGKMKSVKIIELTSYCNVQTFNVDRVRFKTVATELQWRKDKHRFCWRLRGNIRVWTKCSFWYLVMRIFKTLWPRICALFSKLNFLLYCLHTYQNTVDAILLKRCSNTKFWKCVGGVTVKLQIFQMEASNQIRALAEILKLKNHYHSLGKTLDMTTTDLLNVKRKVTTAAQPASKYLTDWATY